MRRSTRLLLAGALAALSFACDPVPPPAPASYPLPDPRPPGEAAAPEPSRDVAIGVSEEDAYADTDPSALSEFREPLEGHGAWVDDPTYGTIWVPSAAEVGPDFVPYVSAGHWVYDDDYVWASDYPWGWAPFHYGRWVFIDGRGWSWIPGRVYAGAWVEWRVGEDGYGYVGWAPMAPGWVWRGGVAVGIGFPLRAPPFVFCPRGEIFAPMVRPHLVLGERAGIMFGETHRWERPGRVTPGWHPLAQPPMHGPAPRSLGFEPGRVPHPDANDHGAARAQGFARPSTAQPLGARAPAAHVVRPAPPAPRSSMPARRAAPRR